MSVVEPARGARDVAELERPSPLGRRVVRELMPAPAEFGKDALPSAEAELYRIVVKRRGDQSTAAKDNVESAGKRIAECFAREAAATQREHEKSHESGRGFFESIGKLIGDFVDDVVHAIKPFVDANYRTLPDRAHTAIAGSSLGGLTADYAIHRHPEAFSMAGVFSPSYWVSDEAFAVAGRTRLPAGSRVYLFMGGKEGPESVRAVEDMARLLRMHPGAAEVRLRVVPEAEHNEASWREAFPGAVRWLFGRGGDAATP